MQLVDAVATAVRSVVFQYPRSDRAGCNEGAGQRELGEGSAFSILGRIERDATSRRLHPR